VNKCRSFYFQPRHKKLNFVYFLNFYCIKPIAGTTLVACLLRLDVILSDIGMPGEDGYSLIRRIHLLPVDKGGGIPALALTAYARPEDRPGYSGRFSKTHG